jgi:hypothetical protein
MNGEGEGEEDGAWQDVEVPQGEEGENDDGEEANPATPVVFPSSSSAHSGPGTAVPDEDDVAVEIPLDPTNPARDSFLSEASSALSLPSTIDGADGSGLAGGLGINLGLAIVGGSSLRREEDRTETAVEAVSESPQRWTPEPFPQHPPADEVPSYDYVPPLPSSSSFTSSSLPPSALQNGSASVRSDRPSLMSHSTSRSTHLSTHSTASAAPSSNSSTLSLPTAPPVDLALPGTVVRPGGTYVSVANSAMASLAAGNAPVNRNSVRVLLLRPLIFRVEFTFFCSPKTALDLLRPLLLLLPPQPLPSHVFSISPFLANSVTFFLSTARWPISFSLRPSRLVFSTPLRHLSPVFCLRQPRPLEQHASAQRRRGRSDA